MDEEVDGDELDDEDGKEGEQEEVDDNERGSNPNASCGSSFAPIFDKKRNKDGLSHGDLVTHVSYNTDACDVLKLS